MVAFNIDNDEFFDRRAVICGKTVKACVFPPDKADPMSETSADADALVSTIVIRSVGDMAWNDPSNPPKVGDEIRVGEQAYAVIGVEPFDNDISIKAKLK